MKNYILKISAYILLAVLSPCFSASGQGKHKVREAEEKSNIRILKHNNYTSYFSVKDHIPLLVTYTLSGDRLTCDTYLKRTNIFAPDPQLPAETDLHYDYTHSGYDRGHNMSAADNGCDVAGMRECFYFSNMTPQPHFFNAGVWEDLEKKERKEAKEYGKLIISVGSVGKAATIGDDEVVVPKYMWKVIYIPLLYIYQCFYFPNNETAERPLGRYKCGLDSIERSTGIIFINGQPRFHQPLQLEITQ